MLIKALLETLKKSEEDSHDSFATRLKTKKLLIADDSDIYQLGYGEVYLFSQ